jgi:rhamnosyltransferase
MRDVESIGVVITAFRPTEATVSTLLSLADNGFKVIVSDNTEGGSCVLHQLCNERPDISVHFNNANLGLGAALNAGLLIAQAIDLEYVLLLDQDTCPSSELIEALLSAHEKATRVAQGGTVVVAPRFGKSSVVPSDYFHDHIELKNVSCLPTAGMFFKLNHIKRHMLFSEDIFLDFCDFEWCWRLAQEGWFFFTVLNCSISQQLGEGQRSFLNININVPAPFRHYFQFRDTLRLASRSYVPFKSKLRFLSVLPLKLFIYPIILDHGLMRLKWMLFGIRDGLLGKGGIGKAREVI